MEVALFLPCYVDQLRPSVGLAAVELLERLGCSVAFPRDQTCCGQPLRNAGDAVGAEALERRHRAIFADYEYVVCPSASCVAHVCRDAETARRTHELCAFLVDVAGVERLEGRFPHRVGLHASCHALRGPGASGGDPARQLLAGLEGIAFAELERADECCGFGGSFAVEEAAVSTRMGLDRLADHQGGGAEVLVSTDVSCLLHLAGLARRQAAGMRALHVAEVLAEASAA